MLQEIHCTAILFDLDGVLVDSTACVERHWTMWAARHRLDVRHILAHSHGRRAIDTMRDSAATFALDLDLEAEARLFEEEQTNDLAGIVITPGALELVGSLLPESWAVVTSGTRIMASTRLEAVGLPIPRIFITAEEVLQGKPDPEGYLKAATLLEIAPRDCLVIEDAPAGIQAAHAGGIRALGVTTTFPVDKLRAAEAEIITSGLQYVHVAYEGTAIHPELTLTIEALI